MMTTQNNGHANCGFVHDQEDVKNTTLNPCNPNIESGGDTIAHEEERPTWSNKTEFLMSCIQTSVGLGNIWRFPFTAYENGGGAFLIPYVIVLFIIGKPMYYLETFIGQFTSQSMLKIWEVNPAFRGVAAGQLVALFFVITYYSSLIALTVYYFFASFASELPWSVCLPEWGPSCVDSISKNNSMLFENSSLNFTEVASSSELYFLKSVLNQTLDISNGIGYPSWRLGLCFLAAWVIVFLILSKGIKSSGKCSYFLALFPYVIMIALLLRAVTLEGSSKGILFFLTPQWHELVNPKIWSEAIQQAFYSLSVGMGPLVVMSSYNKFNHVIYRDVLIVTSLDTCTSLIAGITIFGILGNLAHNLQIDDISKVVKGGTGLAFISYPNAISKFEYLPQVFALLFFFMLFVLGIGSVVALLNVIITVLCDQFSGLKYGRVAAITSVLGFLSGLVYLTPGGQWMTTLVDNFGGTLPFFLLAIIELVAIFYFYGLEKFCIDVEFMTKRRVSFYWRICWFLLAPVIMTIVFIYSNVTKESLKYAGLEFPTKYLFIGWCIFLLAMIQIPIWIIVRFVKSPLPAAKAFVEIFKSTSSWGPRQQNDRTEWQKFHEKMKQKAINAANASGHSRVIRLFNLAFGRY
ncbi:sodium-dependent nutrient amino acid transporter 1-like [Contarinia nasturtii]|uniref:sodium-dependent nutrient amino acid transporter 1-like n=1 Tax=Contarinia nasturtii TaxID=265458 RepID=UPI0012D43E5E|nr:sodium-dependent nutrient amino acid transporter 1-like [Contarinia nasturtii]XP_031628889.1 sodium-dependent nutrient amino acid transporter 1-like [Contarinia nasturtii]XP_031628890.1 sodium-dependent nutrient amino acid transporter 1-like [Contarinia nasturtii]XP_031628891.1 sodium-dependent nutrient amino acid transporter 1-like [Contarinia nasturtii]XP_031628892.1 sodium-dependent nutrient amino acid transporter 1-like [Contarinia nasturtii]